MDTKSVSESLGYPNQAAILLAVMGNDNNAKVLLTQRAGHLSTHAGEVSFPGGMWETRDADLKETALRESQEEVDLEPDAVEIIDQLPSTYTRSGIQVTPYYGRVTGDIHLRPNPEELDSLFWLPILFLKEDPRVRTDIFHYAGRDYWAPVYEYSDYTIWGFSARVLVEFSNRYFGTDIRIDHPAPSRRY